MTVFILGGGTVSHVRSHLALAAPAYGGTALALEKMVKRQQEELEYELILTRMADPRAVLCTHGYAPETNEQVAGEVSRIIGTPGSHVVFHTVAHADWDGEIDQDEHEREVKSGKYAQRMSTRTDAVGHLPSMWLRPAPKIIGEYRKHRKDIYLVACKTTAGATPDQQFLAALRMMKESHVNLVLANDVVTRHNMIVTPEEARYCQTTDRATVLADLFAMAMERSRGTFTRSTVVPGHPVSWRDSPDIPENIRKVMEFCVHSGAYKPGPLGNTAGHFAVRVDANTCLTSRRNTDYTQPGGLDLVRVEYEGLDKVRAHGAKPSVGGQSQRIIFQEHPEADCIVHFHCPPRKGVNSLPTASQYGNECGSHACGQTTSAGLRTVANGGVKAVYLDNHGPNIVFGRETPALTVIDYIRENFDLERSTGGLELA